MPLNTYSDISTFVNPVFEAALSVARDNNLILPLVTTFGDRNDDALRKLQQYGTATINSIAETDDLTSQAFTPTTLSTLTPAEFGAQFFLTDRRIDNDPFGVRADAAMELGLAMAQSVEQAVLGDFSTLTGGTVGAAGTVITWGHFYAALSQLRNQNAPLPYACVLHPYQWHVLAKAVTPAGGAQTNAPNFQDEVTRRFWVQTVGPVDIYVTNNIAVDGSDDAYGAMFSRMALAYDSRRAPRLEPERDASRRGIELNLSSVYAHGAWRPKFGIAMHFDASAPTS